MERLEGRSLAVVIAKDAPLQEERTVFIASQILSALTATHKKNIVHRDLKPENVFLTSISGVEDVVRVLDFGVAKAMDAHEPAFLTHHGALVGTPAYMAPEQARGEEVDARSDLYSVGALMYECLSGLPPIRANNPHAMLVQIQEGIPDPLGALRPELAADLVATIERAMEKHRDDRFETAEQMMEVLAPRLPFTTAPPSSNHPSLPPEEDLIARYMRTTVKEIP
jgi:serine/threonine-protein kinase